MAEPIQTDLSQLRVYTNRGTVAYPLSATGRDPAAESADRTPINTLSADQGYAYKEDVCDELREQLGAIIFRIDSAEGSVWSYFRAQLDKPVQLTGECVADTAGEALESLPKLIEKYVTAVRGGTLDDRSIDELESDAEAQAFATISTDDTVELPWSDRMLREMVSLGPLDIQVPSVSGGVQIARQLALDSIDTNLDVVVTKGSRTDTLADVDVVISIADVEEPTVADPSQLQTARKQVIRQKVAQRLGPLRPLIEKTNTSRQHTVLIADVMAEHAGPIELSIQPRRQAQLQSTVIGLLGIALGLVVAIRLVLPGSIPSVGTVVPAAMSVAGNVAVILSGSVLRQIAVGLVGISFVGLLIGRRFAPGYLPARLSKPLVSTPSWWPTRREQLLGITAVGLIAAIIMLAMALSFA